MKNKKKIAYASLAGVAALSVTSCGKYEDGPKFSLLSKKSRMVGTWDVISNTDSQTGATENYCQNGNYCIEITMDKDNKLTQNLSDGSYSYTYSGTWDFNSDKSELLWTIGGYTQKYEIKRLTNKELWLDDNITSADGDILKLEAN
jgi:hypothetical protein